MRRQIIISIDGQNAGEIHNFLTDIRKFASDRFFKIRELSESSGSSLRNLKAIEPGVELSLQIDKEMKQ